MPNRVQWNSDYCIGHEALDSQHTDILAQCNVLADCIADVGPESTQKFNNCFATLMDQASEHFASEEALLNQWVYPMLEDQQNECDEFGYLANQIITAENFEPIEVQRFLALWWVGHVVGSGKKLRSFLEGRSSTKRSIPVTSSAFSKP